MSRRMARWLATAWVTPLLFLAANAGAVARDDEALGFERTPPRLSFADGAVSFMRQGAQDWTPAQVNTALSSGDVLYTAQGSNLEVQVGPRAYVRAGEQTELGFTSIEPDFLQLRVTSGSVSLDLRSLTAGHSFEVDTPHAAFTVERSGYYRIGVSDELTTFTSRRGGRATVTAPSGESSTIAPSEQVVVRDGNAPVVETYAAPELDAWDRWNYSRTDEQLDAVSARYVPSDVYGMDDLDQYGAWRVVPTYGAMWVPSGVPAGWAPYSNGRWMFDPYYGWTWVDNAPWGWAPFHYGRWVNVSGYWGWCPGPLVRRAYYAPALVAFYGGGGFSLGVSFGSPQVGWVALGWGEPIVPWWGPAHFREHPHWAGWGGPRYVNNVEIHNTTIVNVNEIHNYRNTDVRNAIVEVDRKHFGRQTGRDEPYRRGNPDKLKPVHNDWSVDHDASSLVANARPAEHPGRDADRPTVTARREPRRDTARGAEPERTSSDLVKGQGENGQAHEENRPGHATTSTAEATSPAAGQERPGRPRHEDLSRRPPFGRDSESERQIPPPAPRFEKPERPAPQPPVRRVEPGAAPQSHEAAETQGGHENDIQNRHAYGRGAETPSATLPAPPSEAGARPATPEPPQPRAERGLGSERHERASSPPPPDLPGEPANRVYRQPQQMGGGAERASRAEPQPPAARESGQSGSSQPRAERSNEGHGQRGNRGDRSSEAQPGDRNQ